MAKKAKESAPKTTMRTATSRRAWRQRRRRRPSYPITSSVDEREPLGGAGEHDVERGAAGGGLVLDLLRAYDDDPVELQALGVEPGEHDDPVVPGGSHRGVDGGS